MREQKGFAPILIILVLALIIIGVMVFVFKFNPFDYGKNPTPSPTPNPGLSEDYRSTKKDINDPRYNLLKQKYHYTDSQIEVLTKVAEGDK